MARFPFVSFAFVVALGMTDAHACTPPPAAPLNEAAREAAANYFLIRGTVIQAFDAAKRQPEIIRADEVFIGDDAPRTFVIYRSAQEYDRDLHVPKPGPCQFHNRLYRIGHTFDRLVLVPARSSTSNDLANGRWRFAEGGHDFTDDRVLRVLAEEAKRSGRFRSLPPARPPCCG